jgi:hypothetical protein
MLSDKHFPKTKTNNAQKQFEVYFDSPLNNFVEFH